MQNDGDVWMDLPYTLRISNALQISCQNGILTQGNKPNEMHYRYHQHLLQQRTFDLPLKDTCHFLTSSGKSFTRIIRIPEADPLQPSGWHMINNGQSIFGTSLPNLSGLDLNVPAAWKQKTSEGRNIIGTGVVVAVLDGPSDIEHEDLKDQIYPVPENILPEWINRQVSLTQLKNSQSSEAHGTETAGIIAASGLNGKGLRGIAWGSTFYTVNLLKMQEFLGNKALSTALQGVLAVKETQVVNISLGSSFYGTDNDGEAELAKLYRNHIPVIHASGNEYRTTTAGRIRLDDSCLHNHQDCQSSLTDSLSRSRYAVQVGSVNAQGLKSSYSSTRANMWISALGGEAGYDGSSSDSAGIPAPYSHYSCSMHPYDPDGKQSPWRNFGDITCRYTAKMKGTSAAAAEITGITALLKQIDKSFTVPQIKYLLAQGAKSDLQLPSLQSTSAALNNDLYEEGWLTNGAGLRFSNSFGFGLADAGRSVQLALTCSNDVRCHRRRHLPEMMVKSSPRSCRYTASSEIQCIFSDDKVRAFEIEDVVISFGKLLPDLSSREFRDFDHLIEETVPFYTPLSIELTGSSGTVSIIKSAGSAWMPLSFLGNQHHPTLNMSSSAFYLERSSGSAGWSLTVKNIPPGTDIQDFQQDLSLRIYGYPL